jgi:hypothetical protein
MTTETTKTIQERFDEKNVWFESLDSVDQKLVRLTAIHSLEKDFAETQQGISSSDISHRILSIYEGFKRSGDESIINFCLEF